MTRTQLQLSAQAALCLMYGQRGAGQRRTARTHWYVCQAQPVRAALTRLWTVQCLVSRPRAAPHSASRCLAVERLRVSSVCLIMEAAAARMASCEGADALCFARAALECGVLRSPSSGALKQEVPPTVPCSLIEADL